jgi:hypothetical protein
MRSRTIPVLVVGAALAVALTGCSGGASDGETVARAVGTPASATTSAPASTGGDSNDADDGIDGGTDDSKQSLPPGDPGVDAPGTDDPNGDLGGDNEEPEGDVGKADVPVSALLDTETVNSVAGGGWTLSDKRRDVDSCASPVPAKAVGTRTVAFTQRAAHDDPSSWLIETVSTHAGRKAAKAAVATIGKQLAGCANGAPTDPRIGDASVEATVTDDNGRTSTVTAVAVEGVSFVLTGRGAVTDPDVWAGLTDIAQGNTCEAAAAGCH